MEHKEALLNSLADLRSVHDKASRLMADIAAIGAIALKGGEHLPSLSQLSMYEHLVTQAQHHAARCQELLGRETGQGRAASPPPRQASLH